MADPLPEPLPATATEVTNDHTGSDQVGDDDAAVGAVLELFPPPGFDWTKSTNDNYAVAIEADTTPSLAQAPSAKTKGKTPTPPLVGKYAFARTPDLVDYEWHPYYAPARQLLQDAIVDQFLGACTYEPSGWRRREVRRPWAVFSAGAMGCGKTYSIKYMAQRGDVLPFSCYVPIDPDQIKTLLPETEGYIARNVKTAGSLTHPESSFIQEILQTVTWREGKDVVVDGSLRRAGFFRDVLFPMIRNLYPEYLIAIVYVATTEDVVFERAARRELQTGRHVPPETIRDAIAKVPEAVEALTPDADFVLWIDSTNEPSPVKYVVPRPRTPGEAPVEMEGGLGWDEVGKAWQRVELEAPRVASVTPRAASRSSLADSPDTDPASTASDDSRKRLAGQGGAGDDGPAVPKRARL